MWKKIYLLLVFFGFGSQQKLNYELEEYKLECDFVNLSGRFESSLIFLVEKSLESFLIAVMVVKQ